MAEGLENVQVVIGPTQQNTLLPCSMFVFHTKVVRHSTSLIAEAGQKI